LNLSPFSSVESINLLIFVYDPSVAIHVDSNSLSRNT
jgi:hypothetical protein